MAKDVDRNQYVYGAHTRRGKMNKETKKKNIWLESHAMNRVTDLQDLKKDCQTKLKKLVDAIVKIDRLQDDLYGFVVFTEPAQWNEFTGKFKKKKTEEEFGYLDKRFTELDKEVRG